MRQAAAALFGAGLTVAGCYAAGWLLIDLVIGRLRAALRRDEQIPLTFVLGAACLHLAIFAILALHIAYWPVLVALLAGTIAVAGFRARTGAGRGVRTENGKPVAPLSWALKAVLGLCGGVFGIIYLANAWAPETSPDGAAYHLAEVARQLRAHALTSIPNIYGMLSQGVEMLFIPAFAIGRHSAAALVHLAFSVALALAILAYGRRLGKPWAGATGALLTFVSPIVGVAGSSAYVDVAVGAIVFAAFYWLEIWNEQRGAQGDENGSWRLLIPAGLLAGYAFAGKYTAFPIAIYALGFVAWRSKRLRPVLLTAGCASITAVPWIARNWIWYQNPLAPFANSLFRNPYVHVIAEQDYSEWLRHYDLTTLRDLPLEITVRGTTIGGILGPVFLLLPVALAALRFRAGRRLLLAGAIMLSTYFANVGVRFLIPALPFFSLSLGLALGETAPLLAAIILFHAVTSWPWILNRYVSPACWELRRFPYQAALRITSQDQFLREHNNGYNIARMIEAEVPAGEPVFAMNGIPDSYTTHEIQVSFQSAAYENLADTVNMGWAGGRQPTVGRVFQFPERKAQRLRVLQTAQAPAMRQWSVHELRFYDHGLELARRLDWQLRAWPNPWEVQLAFDNSLATRWRSQETASPRMYIDVDFGREESVDEVRLITAYDYRETELTLESRSPVGDWEKVAGNPRTEALPVPPGIRRMATQEMQAQGIRYLMIYDTDAGADDFADDPEAWGLKLIARGYGVRLYRTLG